MFRFILQRENVLAFRVTEKLQHEDYQHLIPYLEHKLDHHKSLKLLVELDNFDTWGKHAELADLKLGLNSADPIAQLAVVGNSEAWREWYDALELPSEWETDVDMRYFNQTKIDDAWKWLI